MIPVKFPKQIQKFKNTDPDLIQHLQLMTDNLYQVLTRGMSYDANLNSRIVKIDVVSGRPFTLNSPDLTGITGANIINTGGATVTSFKYQSNLRGSLEAVITLDRDATVTFLLIGG